MAFQMEPSFSRHGDQDGEATAYDAIKTEELQIDSILPVEEEVCSAQLAFITIEHGSHSSVVAETPGISQNEPTSSVHEQNHDENGKIHRDGTNEKSRNSKIPNVLQCKECGQKYAHSQSLDTHQREAHGQVELQKTAEGKLQCDQCERQFLAMGSLRKHKEYNHGKISSRPCGQCGKIYALSCVRTHERKCMQNSSSLSCDECGKKFMREFNLSRHKKNCSESRNLQCNGCELRFSTRDAFRRHQKGLRCGGEFLSENRKPYPTIQCDECDKKFIYLQTLTKHRKEFHGYIFSQTCKKCGIKFPSDKIESHVRLCTGLAEEVSTTRNSPHVATLEASKKMQCTPYAMQKHKQSISCDKCGQKFTRTAGLLIHRIVSHGITKAPLLRRLGSQKFTSVQQVAEVNAINTEILQIKSLHPAAEESFSDHNTPSTSTETNQQTTSSSIATELFRDECALLDVIKTEKHTEEVGVITETDQGTTSPSLASELFRDECALSNVIKTEELHIESILPAVEEHVPDPNATSSSTDAYQEIASSGVAFELSQNNRTVIDSSNPVNVIDSSSTMKLPSSGKSFRNTHLMKRHIKIVHEGPTQTCEKCNNEFTPYAIFKHRHSCKEPTLSSGSCDVCDKKFTTMQSLLEHWQITHGVVQKESTSVLKVVEQVNAIQTDELHVESLLPVVKEEACMESDQETNNSSIVTELSPDSCELPVIVNSSSLIEQPNAVASKMHCDEGGQGFTLEHVLRRHIEGVNEGSTRMCEHCGNEYTLHSIRRHSLSCKGSTKFSVSCDECGKKFSRNASLLKHRRVIHGITEAPSPTASEMHCDECGQSFTLASSLRKHMYTACAVQCDECGQNFSSRQYMLNHKKVAHRGTTRTCLQCGNEFSINAILKHRRLCKGPAFSVPCDECGKKFNRTLGLLIHRKLSHGNTKALNLATPRVYCDECGKSFSRAGSLRAHIKTAHKECTRVREKNDVQLAGELVDAVQPRHVHPDVKVEEACIETDQGTNSLSITR